MSILTLEEFFFILSAAWLERKLVVFSKDIAVLTATILTFQSIFKPFSYVMPLTSILPWNLQDLLDSPLPLILGINKGIGYLKELRREHSFSDSIIVDLDAENVHVASGDDEESRNAFEELTNSLPILNEEVCFAYFKANVSFAEYLPMYNKTFRKKFIKQVRSRGGRQSENSRTMFESH